MPTKYLRRANDFSLVDSMALNVHDVLPAGNYIIKMTPENVMYLEKQANFTHPPKLYGHTMQTAQRIIKTFYGRPRGTGVLLSGEKGSGKTLLARTVCIEAAAQENIPTIIINMPWKGDNFFTFLSAITQPCIVLFDEFEKVYDTKENEQDAILTLLDGVFPSKKLFVLTCNDRHGINQNMINRPGRIFYTMEFHGLEEGFIREYAQDNLIDKNHVDSIVRITMLFSEFNFDMLQALIEEMNRYQENPSEALHLLNVSPVHDYASYKTNVLLASGEEVINRHTSPREVRSPLSMKGGIHVCVYTKITTGKKSRRNSPDDDYDEEQHQDHRLVFYPSDVISANGDNLVLKNKDGDILTLTKEKFSDYNWRDTADAVSKFPMED